MNDRELERMTGALPRSIDPPRDLWGDIDARITASRRRARAGTIALAAGVAALAVGALYMAEPDAGDPAASLAYSQIDAAYTPLRQASFARFRSDAGRLDPELRRTVETNLAIIDQAVVAIRAALALRPNDPALAQMLERTYEQELAIVAAVTPPAAAVNPSRYRGAL